MSSVASSLTQSRASAHAMGFSTSTPGTSIWSAITECDAEGFLNSRLRAGGPVLTSIPAFETSVGNDYQENTGLLNGGNRRIFTDAVRQILRDIGIDNHPDIRITGRCSIVNPEPAPIPTILVVFEGDLDIDYSNWYKAAKKIHAKFKARLPETSVELIHEKLLRRPHCHPVPLSHPIAPVWKTICRQILSQSDINTWSGISCWRYGVEDVAEDNPVTVIVSLLESAQGPFTTAVRRIREILAINKVDDVDILFMKDQAIPYSGGFDDWKLRQDALKQYVQPGVSIGIHASDAGTSTLGGLIELKYPRDPEWRQFAMTCFHCVWPPEGKRSNFPGFHPQSKDRSALLSWEFLPVKRNDPRAKQHLQIDQPSLSDICATIREVQEKMKREKTRDFQLLEEKERRGDFMLPYEKRDYEFAKELLQSLESHQKTLLSFLNPHARRLGHVYAGSGLNRVLFRSNGEKRILDWALIRLRSKRSSPKEVLDHNRVRIRGDPERPFNSPPAAAILPTGEFKVFKCGRSSGATQGKLNGLETVRLARMENPQGAGYIVIDALEYQAIGIRGRGFSINGDSGSFVTTEQNEVIGMIISGEPRKNTTSITPMIDLFTDIKYLTHAEDVRILHARRN